MCRPECWQYHNTASDINRKYPRLPPADDVWVLTMLFLATPVTPVLAKLSYNCDPVVTYTTGSEWLERLLSGRCGPAKGAHDADAAAIIRSSAFDSVTLSNH